MRTKYKESNSLTFPADILVWMDVLPRSHNTMLFHRTLALHARCESPNMLYHAYMGQTQVRRKHLQFQESILTSLSFIKVMTNLCCCALPVTINWLENNELILWELSSIFECRTWMTMLATWIDLNLNWIEEKWDENWFRSIQNLLVIMALKEKKKASRRYRSEDTFSFFFTWGLTK